MTTFKTKLITISKHNGLLLGIDATTYDMLETQGVSSLEMTNDNKWGLSYTCWAKYPTNIQCRTYGIPMLNELEVTAEYLMLHTVRDYTTEDGREGVSMTVFVKSRIETVVNDDIMRLLKA